MKSVFTLVCILSAANYATAGCGTLKTYTTEFIPACDANDLYIKWPNYANQSSYYICLAVGYAELIPCPSGDYFTYVMQQCGPCSSYIPAEQCKYLKTQNTPNCVAIGSSTSTSVSTSKSTTSSPTPKYPGNSTVTTASNSTATTVVTPSVVTKSSSSSSTSSTSTTVFAGPPSPATTDASVPMPPTPAPTPPTIVEEPPMAA